jgi:hypothetical protein
MQPFRIGQEVIEKQTMKEIPAGLFKKFGSRPCNKIGRGDSWKTV